MQFHAGHEPAHHHARDVSGMNGMGSIYHRREEKVQEHVVGGGPAAPFGLRAYVTLCGQRHELVAKSRERMSK